MSGAKRQPIADDSRFANGGTLDPGIEFAPAAAKEFYEHSRSIWLRATSEQPKTWRRMVALGGESPTIVLRLQLVKVAHDTGVSVLWASTHN